MIQILSTIFPPISSNLWLLMDWVELVGSRFSCTIPEYISLVVDFKVLSAIHCCFAKPCMCPHCASWMFPSSDYCLNRSMIEGLVFDESFESQTILNKLNFKALTDSFGFKGLGAGTFPPVDPVCLINAYRPQLSKSVFPLAIFFQLTRGKTPVETIQRKFLGSLISSLYFVDWFEARCSLSLCLKHKV